MNLKNGALDPLLAPALKLAELPVLPGRREADALANRLLDVVERVVHMAHGEEDKASSLQLTHIGEALGVAVISLTAYARGKVPKISNAKPNVNLIVPGN